MDNFYRLAYTLSAHLRNYKMITGSTFLANLLDDKWVSEWLLPVTTNTNKTRRSILGSDCVTLILLP